MMNKKLIFPTSLFIFSIFSFFTGTNLAYAQSIKIEVGEAKSKKSLIAMPEFFGGIQSRGLGQGIIKNLQFSTYFDFVKTEDLKSVSSFNDRPSKELKESLMKKGVEFLILTNIFKSGVTKNATFKVYYLSKDLLAMNKTYSSNQKGWSLIANRFSNDFMFKLTGQRSIFNTRIAMTSDRANKGLKEVYTMNWDGTDMQRITYHKTATMSPSWSPGGNQVSYSAITVDPRKRTRNTNLYVYDFRTKKRGLLSSRPGINSGASFYPNGKAIIMTLTQGGNPDLFKIDLTGKVLERITKGRRGAMNVEPSVSPDGSKLAFSSDRSGRPMLYVMDLKNKVPKRLTIAGRYNSTPSWSPNGKKLAFAGWAEGHFDVFTINIDGTGLTRLTQKRKSNGRWSNNESPSFSPDGRFITFISNRSGTKQVYIIRADGSDLKRITNDRHNYFHTQWSPFLK